MYKQLFQKVQRMWSNRHERIVIVSGLPRSGTSMMMQMLNSGGVPVLTDRTRSPDRSNPKGYYEYEQVKQLPNGNVEWLDGASGKAVKVVSSLLEYLPETYSYRVIFLRRDLQEIVRSQNQMVKDLATVGADVSSMELIQRYQTHLSEVIDWLDQRNQIDVYYAYHRHIVERPAIEARNIQRFLQVPLDVCAMQQVVDSTLYRQRT